MSLSFAVIAFFAFTIGLVILPLLPALIEWQTRTDIKPLRVVHESEVDIASFAKGFRSFVDARFRSTLEECRQTRGTLEGTLRKDIRYIAVGSEKLSVLNGAEAIVGTSKRLILASGELRLPPRTVFLGDIYARRSVRGGKGSIYRSILAEESIDLRPSSRSLRWLHAVKQVHAAEGSVLHGRVSAGERINLEEGCGFERLNAPTVAFGATEAGQTTEPSEAPKPVVVLQPDEVPGLIEAEAGRWLVAGELEIPPDVMIEANVVATGRVRVGRGTHIAGSIKSHRDLRLDADVRIEGTVVSGRALHIDVGCRIAGPVLAESEIYLASRSTVGTTHRPTTVSGQRIRAAGGAIVHGTVWAYVDGQVVHRSPEPVEGYASAAG